QMLGDRRQTSIDSHHRQKRLTSSDRECQVDDLFPVESSWDWRSHNAVTPPKNQESCGSCWTFAAVGAIESALIIAKQADPSVDLSEQELVNCASFLGGCQGGD